MFLIYRNRSKFTLGRADMALNASVFFIFNDNAFWFRILIYHLIYKPETCVHAPKFSTIPTFAGIDVMKLITLHPIRIISHAHLVT